MAYERSYDRVPDRRLVWFFSSGCDLGFDDCFPETTPFLLEDPSREPPIELKWTLAGENGCGATSFVLGLTAME